MNIAAVEEIIQRRKGNRKRPEAATIDDITGRHRKIAQLVAVGLTVAQIAERLGVTKQAVAYALKSPIVSQHVKALQTGNDRQAMDVHAEIKKMLPSCIEVLNDCITDDEQPMKLRSDRALQVLAIAGYGPQKNVNVRAQMQHAFLTPDQINELKAEADRAMNNGVELIDEEDVIDVSPA